MYRKKTHRLGEIAGVGAVMTRELEIEQVVSEIMMNDFEKAVEVVKMVLEEAGAPCGSEIRFQRDGREEIISFGRKEGLAI